MVGLIIVVGIVLVCLGGVAVLGGVHRMPSGTLADIGDWGAVSEARIAVLSTVRITNENWLTAVLNDRLRASYHLDVNGVRLATGEATGHDVPLGEETVTLSTAIETDRIPVWWVAYAGDEETIDVVAGGTLSIDAGRQWTVALPTVERQLLGDETPVVDAFASAADGIAGRYTIDTGTMIGEVTQGLLDPGGAAPTVGYEIERGWATWGDVSREETTVVFHFEIHNPGDVPIPPVPDSLQVTMDANDVTLFRARDEAFRLADAATEQPIPPGNRRRVDYPVRMNNDRVSDWFRSHVRNGEQTELRASLRFAFRLPGLGIDVAIPRDGVTTVTCDVRTGMLVDQPTETDCSGLGGIDLGGRDENQGSSASST